MAGDSTIQAFLDSYQRAFEAFDPLAIVEQFCYPCQITSDAGEVTVTVVPTREAWIPQIERLVSTYRAIGVHAAVQVELRSVELTPRLAQATVRWRLVDARGQQLYEFDASYTLADLGQGFRISGIAHNEVPQLNALLERLRARG
jgi:ribosomal protein S17